MKRSLWTSDWLTALVVSLLFAIAGWMQFAPLESLERTAYDIGVRGSDRTPSDRIAVIAIDDQSIANLGRWPWPRDLHAQMIDLLHAGGAKVIASLIFYSEPQIDPGLTYIRELRDVYQKADTPIPALAARLNEAETALDTDTQLAASIAAAGNVVLPMTFVPGEPLGRPDQPLPDYIARNAITTVEDAGSGIQPFSVISPETPPIPLIGKAAARIGHMNPVWDVDGGNRREPLVLRYYDQYFPSTALQVAALSLNLGPDDIRLRLGESVQLGGLRIATTPYLEMNTFYYSAVDGVPAFPVDSFFDVISGKIPPTKYRDKIVLIGASASGVGTPQKTPISAAMAPVVTMAHTVSSILKEDFFVTPSWAPGAEMGAFLVVALYLILALPRMRAGVAAGVSLLILVVLFGVHYGLMTGEAMWLRLMLPATLLIFGHVLVTTKRFLVTEKGKIRSEAESAETNRMLGLAYQGKGDLDMAFACFRKVPMDDTIADLLYNLALDFERKRQFNKAGSVYHHIAEYNPKFRDIEQRTSRSKAMEDTVMLGSGGGGPQATMVLGGDGVQKPMLGRYEVEKELGKGAMGVVYLGKDPKINRVVAIKTMALSQEFEADELEEVKERFFREAETAGRLTHPHIVTIYDAGEEQDLAYIAMEFLQGHDLTRYVKPDKLLPIRTTLDLIAKCASALDYAHAQNVVHRDIKPANIMWDPDSGSLKITDFGIARITDSSKTKTGMVLGTPSYMSPEQLSGKKVDGRSDLFSLGVMTYQLCTGRLPFSGDSMATLMFQIANEPHPDILGVRADLPASLKAIIDKALAKEASARYSRGAQIVADLQACAAEVAG